jgi:hypothetical protein
MTTLPKMICTALKYYLFIIVVAGRPFEYGGRGSLEK